jgi:esterase/lipase superfamily enzyme
MIARPCVRGLALAMVVAGALAPAGCHQPGLVATPNVLVRQDPEQVFASCPAAFQGPGMELLYATDRAAIETPQGSTYGHDRSRRLAFGVATVTVSPEKPWKVLIADSTRAERLADYELRPTGCRQLGSFDPLLHQVEPSENGVRMADAAVSNFGEQQQKLQGLLAERLAQAPDKDVYVFIHGVNNTFEDSLLRAAEVWHFLGRSGVPVVYSWPAGYGGIRGYAHDRESGEFTVFHLKYFLQMVAHCPGVERIHLVTHSRGADVAITALRELHIGYQAQGKDTQAELKLENLVLAAPDLDEDVFLQRFVAENLLRAARRTTIYTSPHDTAIELADLVFASKRRLGTLAPRDLSPKVRQALAKLPNLQLIECKVTNYSTSHDYVFAHPAALSDLILVLRDRRGPGAESGRPLLQPVEGVWELHNDYPQQGGPPGGVMPAAHQTK